MKETFSGTDTYISTQALAVAVNAAITVIIGPKINKIAAYLFEIIFAPVDLPVAAPPSQEIFNNLFFDLKFTS